MFEHKAQSREYSEGAQQLSSSLRSALRWLTHTHAVKIILSFLWLCVTTIFTSKTENGVFLRLSVYSAYSTGTSLTSKKGASKDGGLDGDVG